MISLISLMKNKKHTHTHADTHTHTHHTHTYFIYLKKQQQQQQKNGEGTTRRSRRLSSRGNTVKEPKVNIFLNQLSMLPRPSALCECVCGNGIVRQEEMCCDELLHLQTRVRLVISVTELFRHFVICHSGSFGRGPSVGG